MSVGRALASLCGVWWLLAAGAAGRRVDPELSRLVVFAGATGLVLAVQARVSRLAAPGPRAWLDGTVGVAIGYAAFPAWLALSLAAGRGLGLATASLGPPLPPLSGYTPTWISAVGMAPLFEEMLYRGQLLAALRGALGTPLAISVSSALFAWPHPLPWVALSAGLLGVGLSTLMCVGGSLALCVGLHAGLNLAAAVGGVPAARYALPVGASGWLALAGIGLWLAVRVGPRRSPASATSTGRSAS